MGTQRWSVGIDRTALAAQASHGRSRSSVAGHASSAQRNLVGVGFWGTVARAAQQISAVPNVPSPLPAVGAGRRAGRHLARLGGGVARPRKTGSGGGIHRRLLHRGKKGASPSGRPSAAKGQKSSLAPMITVFLSPFVSKALRRTKVSSSKASSGTASSIPSPHD